MENNNNSFFDGVLFFVTFIATFYLLLVLASCRGPIGPQGAPGASGKDGAVGGQGPMGAQGVAGQDGTSITAVQFCPGYAPTSFPEVGLCIDGKLYAEYYAPPSSGLTYLPDGAYTTTQTSAPCNFIVSGCQVSQ